MERKYSPNTINEAYHKVCEIIANDAEHAEATMDGFRESFAADPMYALSWSNGVFEAAATHKISRQSLLNLCGPTTAARWMRYAHDMIMRERCDRGGMINEVCERVETNAWRRIWTLLNENADIWNDCEKAAIADETPGVGSNEGGRSSSDW